MVLVAGGVYGTKPRPAVIVQEDLFAGSNSVSEVCSWYHQRYHHPMAMTLRLTDEETEALRERAAREGRSMQEVAREAVRDYIERTSKRELLDDVVAQEIPRYAEALRRLGE